MTPLIGHTLERTLGCLRLEDGKEFYVDSAPKEKRRKKKKDESELS